MLRNLGYELLYIFSSPKETKLWKHQKHTIEQLIY